MDLDFESYVKIRQHLHTFPELSGKEDLTAAYIVKQLNLFRPDRILKHIGGHGIVATFNGRQSGKHLAFRAELDALPIQELSKWPYVSQNDGIAHLCGHDGHATTLLMLANKIQDRNFAGNVSLIFQPAEETGSGAVKMLEDTKWNHHEIDQIFAYHNIPGQPLHSILLKANTFTASVKSIILHIEGKTAHAAHPEDGINPIYFINDLIRYCSEREVRDDSNVNFSIITPIHIKVGKKAYGTSAGHGEVHLTLRTWTEESMNALTYDIQNQLDALKDKYKVQTSFMETEIFQSCRNDVGSVNIIKKQAELLDLHIIHKKTPFKWGEDFGAFTQVIPGAMIGIGSGEKTPQLHEPTYDFPDVLLKTGSAVFHQIILANNHD